MDTQRIKMTVGAALTAGGMLLAAPAGIALADKGGGPDGSGPPGTAVSTLAKSGPGAVKGTRPGQNVKLLTPGAGKGNPNHP